ncbi:ABC transporter ATP-binding protein [Flagellimonas meridianipacifica]|uniref:ABC transporter ATP-binding protein n=1 Tax=Flagellimonas meridianipacifica TaxID=1080225 RepID=UPI001304A986|nr:ABC transporter ATP-binding protein [Allomuricauda pacifica]
MRPNAIKGIFASLLLIITSLLSLATPYVLKIIIDDIFPSGNYRDLMNILMLLLGIYIIRILGNLLFEVLFTRINQETINDIRIDLFSSLLREKLGKLKKKRIGELVFLLKDDVETIQDGVSSFGLKIVNNGITIIGILIMLFVLNYKLTFLSLFVLPFIFISTKTFLPEIRKSFKKLQAKDSELHDFYFERIKNIRVIKSFNTYIREKKNATRLQRELIHYYVRISLIKGGSNHLTGFLIAIGPLIVLLYGGKQVFEGLMSLGALVAFLQYLNKLYNPMLNLINSYNELERAKVSMARVYEHFQDNIITPSSFSNPKEFESLFLKNVSISYNNKHVFEEVNLGFQRGNVYGIIGASGSGKTSLIDLICGFLEPCKGTVLMNNVQGIRNISNWNQFYALIEKENQIFSGDVITNIKYGITKTNPQEIKNAIGLSGLFEVINNLEHKEHTVLTNNASILSDGQKQRISFSRAFLKKPPILIIDEATSSLDSKTEELLFENIRRELKESLIIFITHRTASLKYCDKIYEITDRKINLV